jgi:hypothetical protein
MKNPKKVPNIKTNNFNDQIVALYVPHKQWKPKGLDFFSVNFVSFLFQYFLIINLNFIL